MPPEARGTRPHRGRGARWERLLFYGAAALAAWVVHRQSAVHFFTNDDWILLEAAARRGLEGLHRAHFWYYHPVSFRLYFVGLLELFGPDPAVFHAVQAALLGVLLIAVFETVRLATGSGPAAMLAGLGALAGSALPAVAHWAACTAYLIALAAQLAALYALLRIREGAPRVGLLTGAAVLAYLVAWLSRNSMLVFPLALAPLALGSAASARRVRLPLLTLGVAMLLSVAYYLRVACPEWPATTDEALSLAVMLQTWTMAAAAHPFASAALGGTGLALLALARRSSDALVPLAALALATGELLIALPHFALHPAQQRVLFAAELWMAIAIVIAVCALARAFSPAGLRAALARGSWQLPRWLACMALCGALILQASRIEDPYLGRKAGFRCAWRQSAHALAGGAAGATVEAGSATWRFGYQKMLELGWPATRFTFPETGEDPSAGEERIVLEVGGRRCEISPPTPYAPDGAAAVCPLPCAGSVAAAGIAPATPAALEHGGPREREQAAFALGWRADPSPAERASLGRALADPSADVRRSAAVSLWHAGEPLVAMRRLLADAASAPAGMDKLAGAAAAWLGLEQPTVLARAARELHVQILAKGYLGEVARGRALERLGPGLRSSDPTTRVLFGEAFRAAQGGAWSRRALGLLAGADEGLGAGDPLRSELLRLICEGRGRAACEEALAHVPRVAASPVPSLVLGRVLREQGRLEEARGQYPLLRQPGVVGFRSRPTVALEYVRLLRALEQHPEATREASAELTRPLPPERREDHVELARLLCEDAGPERCAEVLGPRDDLAPERELFVGKALLRADRAADALVLYRALWERADLAPRDRFEAGLRVAQCLRSLGRFEEAGRVQREALGLELPPEPRRALLEEIGIADQVDGGA